jgi:hypothetical protein
VDEAVWHDNTLVMIIVMMIIVMPIMIHMHMMGGGGWVHQAATGMGWYGRMRWLLCGCIHAC